LRVAITVPHFALDIGRNESGLGESLARLGHEAVIIATDVNGRHGAAAQAILDAGERPYRVELLRALPGTAINPVPLGTRAKFGEIAPDVIHSSEDTDMLTVATFKAARALGLPFVLSTERYYVPRFPKSVGYRAIERAWTKRIRREADAVTTHSTIQKSFWAQRGLARPDIEMIPVGVWTDRFSPKRTGVLRELTGVPDAATLGFTVGRMTDYKDYPTMMRAFRRVLEKDRSIHLAVAGFGPLRARVVAMARELGLDGNVHFLKARIPHAEMPDALRSADFYLQSSSVEPFGIAVVEAMAAGLPVVATDVGGMSDTIIHGEVGLKSPAGDPGALAANVLALADRAARDRMGEAARRRAVQVFDWMVVCKAYLRAYERALQAAGARRAEAAAAPHPAGPKDAAN
jgi:glycosyltransferase involved in cell wall biosynthesis